MGKKKVANQKNIQKKRYCPECNDLALPEMHCPGRTMLFRCKNEHLNKKSACALQ